MQLVIVSLILKVIDDVLPVCREDIFVCPVQALVDLLSQLALESRRPQSIRLMLTFAQAPV